MKSKIVIIIIFSFHLLSYLDCNCQSGINDITKSSGTDNYYDYGRKTVLDCPFVPSEPDGTINQHYIVTKDAKVGFWASKTNSITLSPGFEASGFIKDGSFTAWFDNAGNYQEQNCGVNPSSVIKEMDDDLDFSTDKANHYKYSKTYQDCWDCLPNGKEINEHKSEGVSFEDLPLNDANTTLVKEDINISDKYKSSYDNYHILIDSKNNIIIDGNGKDGDGKTFFYKDDGIGTDITNDIIGRSNLSRIILKAKLHSKDVSKPDNISFLELKSCTNVTIKNIFVKIDEPDVNDLRIHAIISLRGCDNIKIKNCYFEGPTISSSIRIRNSSNIFIDKVEIGGSLAITTSLKEIVDQKFDFDTKTYYYCGQGIYGNSDMSGNLIIQNCYFHNNTRLDLDTHKGKNSSNNPITITIYPLQTDAIAFGTNDDPTKTLTTFNCNVLVFNNYFENWMPRYGGALDIIGTGISSKASGFVSRIERNIFENANFVKSSGNAAKNCSYFSDCNAHFFTNNIYYNTYLFNYHYRFNVFHVNETFLFDEIYGSDKLGFDNHYFFKIENDLGSWWNYNNIFFNNLINFPKATVFSHFYKFDNCKDCFASNEDISNAFVSNHNLYTSTVKGTLPNLFGEGAWEMISDGVNIESKTAWGINNKRDANSYFKSGIEITSTNTNTNIFVSPIDKTKFYKQRFEVNQAVISVKNNNDYNLNQLGTKQEIIDYFKVFNTGHDDFNFNKNSALFPGIYLEWDYYKHSYPGSLGNYTMYPGAVNPDASKCSIIKKNNLINLDKKSIKDTINEMYFRIYPNPAKEVFTIEYNIKGNNNGKLEIYTIEGQKLTEYDLLKNQNSVTISTSKLSNGLYFYSVVSGGKKLYKDKLIIMRD